MIHELVEEPEEHAPSELHALLESELVDVVELVGVERVTESGVDRATVEALVAGDSPELTLEEAAALLAHHEENPDAATIEQLSRDAILMGMTNAVLDVEALSSGVDGELEPREIQSKVEGRYPMTLREFARLHQYIQQRLQR